MVGNGLCMRQVFGGELAFVFAELPTLAVMHYVLRISLAMHASSAMAVTFRNLAHNVSHSRSSQLLLAIDGYALLCPVFLLFL